MEMKLLEILEKFFSGSQIYFCVYIEKIVSVCALKIKFS